MNTDTLQLTDLSQDEVTALHSYKNASSTDSGESFCFNMNEMLQRCV